MKLNITERIHLLGLLPAEGNAVTLRIVNDLRNSVGLSEEDHKAVELENTKDGAVRWNVAKAEAQIKDIKIGDVAKGVIKEALQKLNDENKLTLAIMPIYEKFMG